MEYLISKFEPSINGKHLNKVILYDGAFKILEINSKELSKIFLNTGGVGRIIDKCAICFVNLDNLPESLSKFTLTTEQINCVEFHDILTELKNSTRLHDAYLGFFKIGE